MAEVSTLTEVRSDRVATLDAAQSETHAARRGAILLIEDRDDVRQGLTQLLALHGFVVTDTPDAQRGLQELALEPLGFALVILDLLLPGPMSGADFRHHQLAESNLAGIPTIVITATDVRSDERALLRADAWLDKPFRFDDLLELVKRYVVPEAGGLTAAAE